MGALQRFRRKKKNALTRKEDRNNGFVHLSGYEIKPGDLVPSENTGVFRGKLVGGKKNVRGTTEASLHKRNRENTSHVDAPEHPTEPKNQLDSKNKGEKHCTPKYTKFKPRRKTCDSHKNVGGTGKGMKRSGKILVVWGVFFWPEFQWEGGVGDGL